MKKRYIIILIFLVLLLFVINYRFIDDYLIEIFTTREPIIVDRVIDGDTIESNETSIRLLGINSPEKGEEGYEEAKKFLEDSILGKKVYLEYGNEKKDKYGRILAYVFLEELNVNVQSVLKGYSNYYFPSGKDKYYFVFKKAWEECINNNKNLCERSKDKCAGCVDIVYENQKVILINYCSLSCDFDDWYVKGEGRSIFSIGDDVGGQDTLFLRDSEDKLVLWKSY